MFANMENFTFDRSSRTAELDHTTRARTRSISPCSSAATAAALAGSHFTLTDLAAQFAGSRLRRDAQICYDSCDAYANLDDDEESWRIEVDDEDDESNDSDRSLPSTSPFSHTPRQPQRAQTWPARTRSPSQRQQRQSNARLLCSTAHHREIAGLVARMVDAREQCSVARSPVTSLSSSSLVSLNSTDRDNADDEGYSSDGNTTSRRDSYTTQSSSTSTSSCVLSPCPRPGFYRRASDRKHVTTASVCKATRFRRESRVSRVRS